MSLVLIHQGREYPVPDGIPGLLAVGGSTLDNVYIPGMGVRMFDVICHKGVWYASYVLDAVRVNGTAVQFEQPLELTNGGTIRVYKHRTFEVRIS